MTRFQVGDRVEVIDLGKPGHVRIPMYIRCKTGTVAQFCGRYLNPEDLAIGKTGGPAIDLYRVSFAQTDLWPEDDHPPGDSLVIEIYDHWLAPAT
ncbi:MAG: SH3-like domain-containing protein [Pseudomonadota bacterium]